MTGGRTWPPRCSGRRSSAPNIKSVGVPTFADQVVIAQGSVAERRFVAVYGYRGRVTAAVTFDQAMWLEFYQKMIEAAAAVPARIPPRRPAGRPAACAGRPACSGDPRPPCHRRGDRPRSERAPRGTGASRPLIPALGARWPRRTCRERPRSWHRPASYDQILDPANRANPYPLYAELRKTPVTREADGTYVVSTY